MAFAMDWPGWSRGATTPAEALATLDAYRRRYRAVALAAGMGNEFDAAGPLEVIQEQVGTGSTDFWGISFAPSDTEQDPMSDTEFDRNISATLPRSRRVVDPSASTWIVSATSCSRMPPWGAA